MKRLDFRLLALGILVLVSCNKTSSTPTESSTEKLTSSKVADKGNSKITAWVVLKEQANLADARGIKDWKARGKAVHEGLQNHADVHQASLRAWLKQNSVEHKPFWIVNTIRVTANQATLDEIAKRPDVAQILADKSFPVPPLLPAAPVVPIEGTEWGLNSIRATDAWTSFGAFGDGIVVASVDTGVQYDHPALVNQYRGRQADGSFNHNYNWFDPSSSCGSPSLVPCDNNNHGTHTMGTMVGDDGSPGTNRIGVAPHAKWIAAKGCEQSSCSTSSLLAAGQWILAPTDLNGQNPRSDLRPNVVNNSWGGGGGDTWYQQIVQNWVAAGIFPAFANGNAGSGCSSSGSPGDYPESYSAGAYDVNNVIASFSSRGPSAFGSLIKPNIAAPGVSVRSSIPGNSYASYSGTSMATPHLSGSVALLWSAAPSLIGDIAATEALLSQTAVDTADTSCGGTAANNNVWGEGRLDIYAAIDQAPRGPSGTLRGTVTTASGGAALGGATITISDGTRTRTTSADSTGAYQNTLQVGSYTVTASMYGYQSSTATGVGISDGATTVQNFQLVTVPSHSLSGHVRDDQGAAVPNVKVTIVGTPLTPATTGADGSYSFPAVPDGEYDVKVDSTGCLAGQTLHVILNANATLDFAVTARKDSFGYSCKAASYAFIDANTVLSLTGDDASATVALPFPFFFYGQTYNTAYVSTNGVVNFLAAEASYTNVGIPSTSLPNAAIYALWDDLSVDSGTGSVRTQLVGTAPNRSFVIEWRSVHFLGTTTPVLRFEMVLSENGQVTFQYATVGTDGRAQGNSATIGIENSSGTVALQYAYDQAVLSDGQAITFVPPPYTPPVNTAPVVNAGPDQTITLPATASLSGTATDDGLPNPPSALTTTWSVVSGTGTVTFANPAALATTATFSAAGTYTLRLTASDSALSSSDDIVITVNPAPPSHSLSGHVRDGQGAALANVKVTVVGTSLAPATTGADGSYSFAAVVEGEYDVRVDSNGCLAGQTLHVIINADKTLDFTVAARQDSFGYSCGAAANAYVAANTVLALTGDDNAAAVTLPFPFTFYGQAYSTAYVTTNGVVSFLSPDASFSNTSIPSTPTPNAAIYALWDDLYVDSGIGSVRTQLVGTAPNRSFVIEWRSVRFLGISTPLIGFEVVLSESGQVLLQYGTVGSNGQAQGNSATIGIENSLGTVALQYSYNQAVLSDGQAIVFVPPNTPPPVNTAPVVNAGNDQTITLPMVANLAGTATDDGLPNPPATVTTTWSVVSGTGTVTFGNVNALSTTATFSASGTYTLRLTASDSALSTSDDVVITVNPPTPVNQAPVVNAGPDQAITLPATASLSGTATDDGLPNPPATVTTTWTKASGPGTVTFGNASALNTTATFSAAGSYTLRLTANDSALSASDDVVVMVNPPVPVNQPPVVNAGADQTITLPATASLSGTVTDDGLPNPPATVTTTWTKVSGPGTVTFGNASLRATTATFSSAGSYTLRLTANDSALSASDDLVVTVNAPVNQAPVVNAGPDQTITLPATASLSGTATDDGLPNPPATVTTTWSKVSGPGTVTFGNASLRATTVTFSVAGSYTLRLTASDSALSASDDIVVTVNAAPVNHAPVPNAGPDQTIILPATASLSGTVTDDGLPSPPATVTTTWSKVSGPGTVTFGNAGARATTATFSTAGSYTLRLTANDSALTGTDDIIITVLAAGTTPCTGLCTNPITFTVNGSYQSGNLGTGAVCYQTTSNMTSGNCGNLVSPRVLKVNGTTEPCTGANWASVPAKRNGGYCIQTTTGNQSWAYFTAW